MTIRFDLRPPQYRQTQKRYAVDRGKILFFLALLLMMLSSGGVAGYQAFRLHALSLSLMDLESSVAALQAQDGKLARTVQDLQQEIAFYEGARDLVKEELTALELLGAMEGALPGTVWIERVDVVAGAATLTGLGFSDGVVVIFSNALANAAVVAEVLVPVISQSGEGLKRTVRFTMTCKLRDLTALITPR